MEKFSISIVKQMISQKVILEEFKDCYIYGLQLLFSNILIFGFILLLSLITNSLLIALLFSIAFCSLRAIFGGYHCKQYNHCFIISTGLFCILLLLTLLPFQGQIILSMVLLPLGLVTFIYYISINKKQSSNHKFIHKDILGAFFLFACLTFSILFFFFAPTFSLPLSYAVFTTALLFVWEKIEIKAVR